MAALETPSSARDRGGRAGDPRWGWRVSGVFRRRAMVRRKPRIELAHVCSPCRCCAHGASPCRAAPVGDWRPWWSAATRAGRAWIWCSSDGYHQAQEWPAIEQGPAGCQAAICAGSPSVCHVQETWIQRLHRGKPGLGWGWAAVSYVWQGTKKRPRLDGKPARSMVVPALSGTTAGGDFPARVCLGGAPRGGEPCCVLTSGVLEPAVDSRFSGSRTGLARTKANRQEEKWNDRQGMSTSGPKA